MDGSIVIALGGDAAGRAREPPSDAPEEPVQPPRFAVGARVEARFEAARRGTPA